MPYTVNPGQSFSVPYAFLHDKSGGVIGITTGGFGGCFSVSGDCNWLYSPGPNIFSIASLFGASGSVTLQAPSSPGSYTVYAAYQRDGGTLFTDTLSVVAPPTVNVPPPPPPPPAPAPPPASAPAPQANPAAAAAAATAAAQAASAAATAAAPTAPAAAQAAQAAAQAAQAAAAAATANPNPTTAAAAASAAQNAANAATAAAAAAPAASGAAQTAQQAAATAQAAVGGSSSSLLNGISKNPLLLVGGALLFVLLVRR